MILIQKKHGGVKAVQFTVISGQYPENTQSFLEIHPIPIRLKILMSRIQAFHEVRAHPEAYLCLIFTISGQIYLRVSLPVVN